MFLSITNKGEMQQEAMTLLGASTKRGDDTKIGFFGSGLKYALAVMIREGIEFHIYSGSAKSGEASACYQWVRVSVGGYDSFDTSGN